MIVLLLACANDEPGRDSAVEDTLPFEPLSGSYVVTMAQEFEGCALGDPKTGHVVDDHWDLLIDGDRVRWWANDQPSRQGIMDGLDFLIDLGTYANDYSPYGYDAFESITYSIGATFDAPTSFAGSYDIGLTCEGADCAYVGTGWGKELVYPCVASAPFVGTAE